MCSHKIICMNRHSYLLLSFALMSFACGSTSSDKIFSDPNESIVVNAKSVFRIGLETSGFSGLTWELVSTSPANALEFVSKESIRSDHNCCDQFGSVVYTFRAQTSVEAFVRFQPNHGPERIFSVMIENE